MRMRALCCFLISLASVGAAYADAPSSHANARTSTAENCAPSRRVRCPTVFEALAAANQAARQSPLNGGFVQARHIYGYTPGGIYELQASPNFVSMILLQPGEAIQSIAAGDTARWMVTEAEAEAAATARAVVLVKPQASGLRTNIVLITDRRTYLIEARSGPSEAYAAEIAWSYPPSEPGAESGQAPLNYDYRVRTTRGRAPRWMPTRVYDDGRRTWIEFAPGIAATDMPPLFIVTPEGAELVNYRVLGQRYMLDRVFDVAELRFGARAPTVVRVERRGRVR